MSSSKLYVLALLSRRLAQGVDLDELLEEAAEQVAKAMEAERVTLYLLEPEREELWSKVAHLPEIPEIRLKVGRGVAGYVAKTGKILRVDSSYKDPRFCEDFDKKTGFRTTSQIVAPLKNWQGEVMGVVQILNKKKGAFTKEDEDFLQVLSDQLSRLLETTSLFSQIQEAKQRKRCLFPLKSHYNHLVARSEAMQKVLNRVAKVAPTSATVLIRGETGVGKEALARVIHMNSPFFEEPFVKVDCASLPETLLENELFGHEKGAYTGAVSSKPGKVEAAGRGTLFIDEIGELPLRLQAKLLRLFQDREFEPLGSTKTRTVQARFLVATHRDLEKMVQQGTFRQDLYYRIRVAEIWIPPLRERGREEILALAYHFLFQFSRRYGKKIQGISKAGEEKLVHYSWPGNVRELEHCIESAVIFAETPWLREEDLHLPSSKEGETPLLTLEEVERRHICRVLAYTRGNKSQAARILGIGRNTLDRKIAKYGISVGK